MNDWQTPPDLLILKPYDLHVWQARLDVESDSLAAFAQTLSGDERLRADRFQFHVHRDRFIAGRGILRSLLSRYLDCLPQALTFSYGVHGKPALLSCQAYNCQALQFNVAHSQDRALYILSRDASELGRANRTVGIDIEQIRNVDRLEALTRRFFSAIEHAAICDAEAHQRSRLFFRYWTCKEAYLKATGDGLGKLGDLEISLSVEQSARFQRLPANESTQQWYLQELELDSDFVGALSARYSPTCSSSAESPEPSFRVHQFTFDPQ